MEPIAKGVAARGHEVHLVAPWHPAITRGSPEDGVQFHFYKYAPVSSLSVFGYASGLKADTSLRPAAWLAAPLALAAGWRTARHVAQRYGATVLHGHWVIPGGVIAALASGRRPLVVSLHGSDVYVAEHYRPLRAFARRVFRRAQWVTACSDDLAQRAVRLGADPERTETVPYGVDTVRFAPRPAERLGTRDRIGVGDAPFVFSAGRLVRKKGFEFLIDAAGHLMRRMPGLRLAIAGDGDLREELERRARQTRVPVIFLGATSQDEVGRLAAAADVVVVPSVRDADGNVDGLPNFALEAMATATPVVATRAGGLADAVSDGFTGRLVRERDAVSLADAIGELLSDPAVRERLGHAAREDVIARYAWGRMAERFERAYDRACGRS